MGETSDEESDDKQSVQYLVKSDIYGTDDWLSFVEVDGMAIHQGDVLLGAIKDLEVSKVDDIDFSTISVELSFIKSVRTWPGGIIPYSIDPQLPNPERVLAAIQTWESQTNIRFIPKTTEEGFARFSPTASGCRANLGYGGTQERLVLLADDCNEQAVLHEIGHVVGMSHEHNRPDRDTYIDIQWDNIKEEAKADFMIPQFSVAWGPYNPNSIMHYVDAAGTKNGNKTIVGRNGVVVQTALPNNLSAGDTLAVNTFHKTLGNPDHCDVKDKDISTQIFSDQRTNESYYYWQAKGTGTERACRALCEAWETPKGENWTLELISWNSSAETVNWYCRAHPPKSEKTN